MFTVGGAWLHIVITGPWDPINGIGDDFFGEK